MEICLHGIWRLLILLPTHAANLSYQGDMSPSKDDMGPHSVAPGPALCRAACLPETFWDAGEGSSLQLHPQASVSVCCFSFLGFFLSAGFGFIFLMWLFVFLTVCSSSWRCCLKCLLRGAHDLLGTQQCKISRAVLLLVPHPGWRWSPLPADLLLPLGEEGSLS